MNISYLLVLIALAALAGAIWALFWAIDSGQYDDLESQGGTPLEDENGDGPAGGNSSLPGRSCTPPRADALEVGTVPLHGHRADPARSLN